MVQAGNAALFGKRLFNSEHDHVIVTISFGSDVFAAICCEELLRPLAATHGPPCRG
jgi:hypothetical protein